MGQLFDSTGKMGAGDASANDQGTDQTGHGIIRTPASGKSANGHSGPSETPVGLDHYRGVPAFGVLQYAAEQLPNREGIRYGNKSFTYQQLNRDAIACAAMLRRLGVQPGDRVGILLPNVSEYIIAANGIWRAGGVVVAISPLMVEHEVEKFLQHTDCRFVICLDLLAHMLEREDWEREGGQLEKILLVSIREQLPAHKQLGYLSMRHRSSGVWMMPANERRGWFWDEMDQTEPRWQQTTIKTDTTPACILPTGGTTGTPHAVTLSHQNMVANAWQQYMWSGKKFGQEIMMGILPFFLCYGISTALGGVMMGATLILHDRFNTQQIMRLIEHERPTIFHAVPSMLVAINLRMRSRRVDLSSLQWVISGGASLDESVGREFAENTGALVAEGYGLSEASPVTHVGDLSAPQKYGVIGLPLPETECQIVDAETGAPIQPGEVGELLLRGPQVMLGYWNEPSATKEAIRDGWLHTGDLVVRHADGNYSVVGRKKELIITSGFNVYPGEVEATLREADDVAEASVVGQPDEKRGEAVKAFIILKAGTTWDEKKLRAHCSQRLSKHKRPRVFEQCFGELPPKTPSKVFPRALPDSMNHVDGSQPTEESN
jgi:long-chain acyl-CoA synthetase